MIDLQQIELVRSSWQQLKERSDQAGSQFYGYLFSQDSELRALFKSDSFEQGRKLMMMLNAVISQLDNIEQLRPQLLQLGLRHQDYGVVESDYLAFEQALFWTLEQNLGACFNLDSQQAWRDLFLFLKQTMQITSTVAATNA